MLCSQLRCNTDFCALINSLSLTHVNDPGACTELFISLFPGRHLTSPLTTTCLHGNIPFELNCEYSALFFFVVLSLENSQCALGQSDPGTSVKRGLHQTSKNCSSEGLVDKHLHNSCMVLSIPSPEQSREWGQIIGGSQARCFFEHQRREFGALLTG